MKRISHPILVKFVAAPDDFGIKDKVLIYDCINDGMIIFLLIGVPNAMGSQVSNVQMSLSTFEKCTIEIVHLS